MIPMSAASWEEELRRVLSERWQLTPLELTDTTNRLYDLADEIVQCAVNCTTLNYTMARAQITPKSQYAAVGLVQVTPTLAIEALCGSLDTILLPEAAQFVRHTALEALRK